MKVFWTYNDIPEFQTLTKKERKHAWACIAPKLIKHPKVKKVYYASILVPLLFVIVGGNIDFFDSLALRVVTASVFGAVGGMIGGMMQSMRFRQYMQPYIDGYFASHETNTGY